jgi:hypothetical protein
MKNWVTAFLSILVLVAGCTPSIRSEIYPNQNYNISDLKTFAWANDHPLSVIGVLVGSPTGQLETVLKEEVSAQLVSKGYSLVERTNNPDFVIVFTAGAMDQMTHSVHRVDRNRMAYDATVMWSQMNDSLEGAVSIELQDPASEETTIWRGAATDRIKSKDSRKQDGSTVRRLVQELMKSFPTRS